MELYSLLTPEEKAYHDALVRIAQEYGPFDKGSGSIWVGYESAQDNENAEIGVKCANCTFHYATEDGQMGCKIVSFLVEPNAYCRLAAIPDGLVTPKAETEKVADEIDKQSPCWDGYVQRGMKPGKDGKPVPNCVPAKKQSFWGGKFSKNLNCCPE